MARLEAFAVPEAAAAAIHLFLEPAEVAVIEEMGAESFSASDAVPALSAATGERWTEARAHGLLGEAYRRGVLRVIDEAGGRYAVASFSERLEVMAAAQPEEYLALDADLREALDAWSFDAYLAGLGPEERPTSDTVATLDEALAFIDRATRPAFLNHCDCRVLAGHCGHPTRTCISFRDGVNTMSHRGWSEPLSKDQAKEVVRRANADGLMQTLSDNGVCNCCSDCCYLFRAQEARRSGVTWPLSRTVASVDSSLCALCGECVERCPFNVFTLGDHELVTIIDRCRGCGLCAETCPADAIAMAAPGEDDR
jgi:Pyruvate/2-oxoacid:ferredoxin oxidoreductase delta subunit